MREPKSTVDVVPTLMLVSGIHRQGHTSTLVFCQHRELPITQEYAVHYCTEYAHRLS